MDDIAKVMDAISVLQDMLLAATVKDEASILKLKGREGVPEAFMSYLVKEDEPEAEIEEEAPIAVSGAPAREAFESDLEFAKAVMVYHDAQEAKKGITTSDLATGFAAFEKKLREEVFPEMGEALKKSLVPEQHTAEKETANLNALWSGAGKAQNLSDFLYKEGIEI